SQGDFNMIMNVLQLVGNDNNSNIISKIAYGLGTSNGISLGLVGNFLDKYNSFTQPRFHIVFITKIRTKAIFSLGIQHF
ncbi:MAG: hypothetical protein J6D06_00475, partial [Clostridia bacterium]|nr:hypothetical protein [Clostridia bacterium]